MSDDLPHQVRNADFIARRLRSGLNSGDWSETGTGKTRTALRVIRTAPEPTLVVVPKISIGAWKAAGADTGTEFDVTNWEALRYGTTPFGWWERRKRGAVAWERMDFRAEPTDIMAEIDAVLRVVRRGADSPEGFAERLTALYRELRIPVPAEAEDKDIITTLSAMRALLRDRQKLVWYYRFAFHPAIRRVVFDEFHRAKGATSHNSAMVRAGIRQRVQLLGLSATPAADPTEMRALGAMLGWFDWEDFRPWCLKNGCFRPPFGGVRFVTGDATCEHYLAPLRMKLVDAGPKTTLREVHPDHALVINPLLVNLDEGATEELNRLHARSAEIIERLQRREAEANSPLSERIFIRQRLELLRVPAMVERARDLREAGNTVLFFLNFRASMAAIRSAFPGAVVIDGVTPPKERQWAMRAISDGSRREAILQSAAGGESISMQDVSGIRPVVSLVSVPESAPQLIQIAGRTDRLLSRSTPIMEPVFAAGTVEEHIWRRVSAKADRIMSLTDRDLLPC